MVTKCFHPMCDKKFPRDSLFRVNAKGQPGIWACLHHIKNTDKSPDPLLETIVQILERNNKL